MVPFDYIALCHCDIRNVTSDSRSPLFFFACTLKRWVWSTRLTLQLSPRLFVYVIVYGKARLFISVMVGYMHMHNDQTMLANHVRDINA